MKHKAARREVLRAIAEFEQGCLEFSERAHKALEPPDQPATTTVLHPYSGLPRKPAKRAQRSGGDVQVRAAGGRK